MSPLLIPVASALVSAAMKAIPIDTLAALVNFKISKWANRQMGKGNVVEVAKTLRRVEETDWARLEAVTGQTGNRDFAKRFLEATAAGRPTPKDGEPRNADR